MASGGWFARSLRSRTGLIQWVLLLLSVAFVAWLLVTRADDLRSAFELTPRLFWLITLSSYGTFALNGVELQVLSRKFGSHIPIKEALALGLMVSTLNYLPMKTGTVLNGIILKARYKLPLTDFAALVLGSSFIHLWVALSLAGISLLFGAGTEIAWGLLMLLGPTVVVAGLVIWGRLRETGKHEGHESRVVRVASRAVDGIGMIFSDPKLLVTDLSINVGLILLWAARAYWSFQALGIQASFASVLTVSALGIVFTRLSVIPGGVGFREAGSAFGSAITGLPANAGMAASVIDRAVMLVWLLAIGVPTTMWMMRITGVHLEEAFAAGKPREEALEDGAQ